MGIFKAIKNNDIAKVKELLDSGIDINAKDNSGNSPLHIACLDNQIDIVKLLLEHPNIDVNIKNYKGETALHITCNNNNIQIVKLLLARLEIDVNIKDNNGNTPLGISCFYNYIEIVKLLLTNPKIEMNLNYKNYKNFKIRTLLKSHINTYKNSVNKILDSIEN